MPASRRLSAQPGGELTDVAAVTLPVDPTDRRAPADVGGRLNVTKGWTLSIPAPEESRGSYAAALSRQAAASAAAAQSPAAVSNVVERNERFPAWRVDEAGQSLGRLRQPDGPRLVIMISAAGFSPVPGLGGDRHRSTR